MIEKNWRAFLSVLLVIGLAGCRMASADVNTVQGIKRGSDMTFFISSDIHYLARSLTDGGPAFQDYFSKGDGKQLDDIDEILSTFSYELKNKKPEVLILSGDLTNNGEKESHLELSERLREIESNGTSVYVIPGNHDILNTTACEFKGEDAYVAEYITSKEFSKIYGDFGYDKAILRDKGSLSYLAAASEDIWLLMLDTSQYKDNLKNPYPRGDGEISKGTLKWIKKCTALAKKKGAQIITVMHHNLLDHNELLQAGYTINNSSEVLGVFEKEGLNLNFSGHIHAQDISSHKNGENATYDVASGSLAAYPQQYGILKYTAETSSLDYSTSRLDVEEWAKAVGAKRISLYNFKKNSEEFFGQSAYDKAYSQLTRDGNYSEEQKKVMSETKRLLNLRYFAGRENLNMEDVVNSEGYKLWTQSPESRQKTYIMSVVEDRDTDDNNLHIPLKNNR